MFVLAFVFFLLATLLAGGVISGSLPWLIPAGLTCIALGFLVDGVVVPVFTRRTA
jgi:hypothetical protein